MLAALVVLLAITSVPAQDKAKPPKPGKGAEIVFVGNSLTHFHDLPAFVRALGAHDKPARKLKTVMLAPGGYTLQQHLEFPQKPRPLDVIKKHKPAFVVLQDQSARPLERPKLMMESARTFAAACKKNRSVPVWYMTFARQHQPHLQDKISGQYEKVQRQCGGLLAPVGRAWQTLRKSQPKLDLHMQDRVHPSRMGAYLTACVLYGTMFGGDITHFPDKLMVTNANGKPKVLVDLQPGVGKLLRSAAQKTIASNARAAAAAARKR